MTNVVAAAVALLIETNSSRVIPHPSGFGATTYITNVASEVITYTNLGVARTITNAVDTNVVEMSVRKLMPEVPPVRNQPHKP
jgi:hypothetical protein